MTRFKILPVFFFFLLIVLWVSCNEDDELPEDPTIYTSDLAGTFRAEARLFNNQPNGGGPDLDYCSDLWWAGILVFETVSNPDVDTFVAYKIYTENDLGDMVEDPAMGSYYNCYEGTQTDPNALPNGANSEGSLHIRDNNGALIWYGGSQWGEIYQFNSVTVSDEVLYLIFENDYAESFEVIITRQDGINWHPDLRDGDG